MFGGKMIYEPSLSLFFSLLVLVQLLNDHRDVVSFSVLITFFASLTPKKQHISCVILTLNLMLILTNMNLSIVTLLSRNVLPLKWRGFFSLPPSIVILSFLTFRCI
jgi:hypothetical protein